MIRRVCSIEDCDRVHHGRGWCKMHYYRWRRNGDPLTLIRPKTIPPGTVCAVDGCSDEYSIKGLCMKHITRLRQHGSVHHVERIVGDDLARLMSYVEAQGDCWVWTGVTVLGGYGRIKVDGRKELAHRVSYELHVGPIPDDKEIDHECCNPPCVNPAHLAAVTHEEHVARTVERRRASCES